jgi:hypothetical protein
MDQINWEGYEVPTREAVWVCVNCEEEPRKAEIVDAVDYLLEFDAREPTRLDVPKRRKLRLRTSRAALAHTPGFRDFLSLVISGQMNETDPWDRFKEVYERD